MYSFIICIVCGIWHIYNFITYIHPEWMLPFFQIAPEGANILRVLNMICLNWSPFLGGMLIIFGITGLRVRESDMNNFESFKFFMVAFALVTSFILIL